MQLIHRSDSYRAVIEPTASIVTPRVPVVVPVNSHGGLVLANAERLTGPVAPPGYTHYYGAT